MPLNIYQAYKRSVAKQPVNEWRELMQESTDDTWIDTSTLTTVQGQAANGSKSFSEESVQLNSVLNPKSGQAFGDDYRKIIYQSYVQNELTPEGNPDSQRFLGKYYQFENSTWLIINTNTIIGALTTAIVRKCNNMLRWYDKSGILHEWPCVFDRNLTSTNFDEGSEGVYEIGADAVIQVQRNEETDSIPYNQRFLFDGHAFQIKQINNHVSPTYMEFYIFETQVQANDNTEDDIANIPSNINQNANEIQILPQITTLSQGKSQTFSVYQYIEGETSQDVFNVVASGPIVGVNYNLTINDGNHFTIENLIQNSIPLHIVCTNTASQEQVSMDILLTGGW